MEPTTSGFDQLLFVFPRKSYTFPSVAFGLKRSMFAMMMMMIIIITMIIFLCSDDME